MTQAPTLTARQPEDAFGKVSKRHVDSKLWGLDLKPALSDFELILFSPSLFGDLVQVTCRAQGVCPRSEMVSGRWILLHLSRGHATQD